MPERKLPMTESKQFRQHVDSLTNFLVERGVKLTTARTIAVEMLKNPTPEVMAAMRHVYWKTRKRKILKVGDKRHGLNGYTNYGCRCDICKEAGQRDLLERRKRRYLEGLPDGDERHGTYNGYTNYGCRCEHCKLAARNRVVGRGR